MIQNSDEQLVRAALDGDQDASGELARRWSPRVLAICHARCGRADVAEDLAQESLLRALRSLHTLQQPHLFGAWLRGIAVRVVLDWRKAKQTSQVPFSTLDETSADWLLAADDDPGAGIEHADDVQQLLAAVAGLPDDARELLLLYYYDHLTYRDLADLLGVSIATINARLAKARLLLQKQIRPTPSQDRT